MPTPTVADVIAWQGCGMGFRDQIASALDQQPQAVDVLEVITEQFFSNPEELERLRSRWKIILHGVELSMGSMGRMDRAYLERLRLASQYSESAYLSDHLSFTRAPGLSLVNLTPLYFSPKVLRNAVDHIKEIQDFTGKLLVLENITEVFTIPGAPLSGPEFFSQVVEESGCGILLDVTNVAINSHNHGFDAYQYLQSLPLNRVFHIHIAGGHQDGDWAVDSHSQPVSEQTWELLAWVAPRSSVKTVILEHDSNFPESIQPLFDQVARARSILQSL